MRIDIASEASVSCGDVVGALSKLYRSDPVPPHFFLAYDILYEPENTWIVASIDGKGSVDSYILVWRGVGFYGVHLWGSRACKLLNSVSLERGKAVHIHLYTGDEKVISYVRKWLARKGFVDSEVRWYHEMICTRGWFTPSGNESLVTRLGIEHAEIFIEFMRSRGIEIDADTAKSLLRSRQYHAVIIDREIASAGAICAKLPELSIICDVYTKPSFRGRGYATAVTSKLTRTVIDAESRALLYVEVGNELAIKVYTKLGYRISRTLPWLVAKT
jgi:GNAT superfamily N-acetyltransferase